MTEKLRPCPNPWCQASAPQTLSPDIYAETWAVECVTCKVRSPECATEAEAAAAWNTRPTETVNEQMLRAMREAREFIENLQLPDAEWERVLDICVAAISRADVALRGPCCREPWCEGDCTCEICAPELAARDRAAEAAQKESEGVALIAAERLRQVQQEGWTEEHDDEHTMGEMPAAAMSYAELCVDEEIRAVRSPYTHNTHTPPDWWPWERKWWKPSPDPIRNLVKAGALIAAEIDRLKRLPSPPTATEQKEELE